MERVECGDVGSLLLEMAERASRVVGVRLDSNGKGELDIFRNEIDNDVSALFPIISLREFSIIQAIMISEDGKQMLLSGSENLPIELVCRNMIDEIVDRLRENNGMFCNTCRNSFRIRHWIVRRTGNDRYECIMLPRKVKDVIFWNGGLLGCWSDEPNKLYFLPEAAVNDSCFDRRFWQFVHEIEKLRTISWRSEDNNIIIASCNERVVWLKKCRDGLGLEEIKTIYTPGYNFTVRGITGDGFMLLTVSHRCESTDMTFELVTAYDFSQLCMFFCKHE